MAMDEPTVTKTKEDTQAGLECNKKHAHCFISRALLTNNVLVPAAPWILTFTATFWDTWEKTCDEKYHNCSTPALGCCIIIMHLLTHPSRWCSFWQEPTGWSSLTLHTHLTQPTVTSSCFSKWNWSWRDTTSTPQIQNRRQYQTAFRTRASAVLLKRKKGARIAV